MIATGLYLQPIEALGTTFETANMCFIEVGDPRSTSQYMPDVGCTMFTIHDT